MLTSEFRALTPAELAAEAARRTAALKAPGSRLSSV